MRKNKVKLSFRYYPVPKLAAYSGTLVFKMGDNPYFPVPDVPLAEIAIAGTNVSTKYQLSRNRGKVEIAEMHESVKVLLDLLYREADYVERVSNGVESVILSSGFESTKNPFPALRPEFSVHIGAKDGQIKLKHKAVKGAVAYLWQYVKDTLPDNEKQWILACATACAKCVVEDLESANRYWFRVIPVTRKGMLPASEPMMKVVG